MSTPVCPQHGKPLRQSEKGDSFYCPIPHGETPEGKKIWYRVKAEKPAAPSANGIGTDSTLAAAALTFAGSVYRGAGGELGDEAIQLAIRAYSALKAAQP